MKKEINWLLVALLVNAGVVCAAPSTRACQANASAFLANPDERTLAALGPNVGDQCWQIIGKSNSNLKKLLDSVSSGNYSAASYLAKNLKSLDGGNLEDSLVALGDFSDTRMTDLLAFANKGLISPHELTDALTMLPLSMSDNQAAQLSAMQARRSKVNKVTRSDLVIRKSAALKAIDDFIGEIKSSQH
ncbi:hypothetical protein DWU98_09900 [Dyella monticola]|uniref:Uncharacterized protein n=1 Tax=Dyella monticola TaxID=1927958 RepID=A0A370X1N5_9GAMM|nr:hypothetical protein [Dyella monticola]RDS82323.1 hypothetical protein DWU98_09900 [Dyella monticola]